MLDDSKGWNVASQKEMEEYTATTFIAKARFELVKSAPDLGQSAEKIWLAAACAVKELYLSCGDTICEAVAGIKCRSCAETSMALANFMRGNMRRSSQMLKYLGSQWKYNSETQLCYKEQQFRTSGLVSVEFGFEVHLGIS
ncbi:unnamed protein product, partial [Mesorhabditis belari]|uniref:Uncharacterized protein n=1 Tax=Mesorhabditis belari TaxID=2138241 RepID=A0AAF3J266_9BILA